MIEVRNLEKAFGDLKVLRGITEKIEDKEVVCVIGPSGSGKSTFLRCLNMLEEPTGGEVYLDGKRINEPGINIDEVREKLGMVFQSFNLFPHMTVMDNITLAPIKVKGMSGEEAEVKAKQLLKTVGLEDKADSYPASLSGGQKQRVAIAGAVAMQPECIVFDEPTAMLDPRGRQEVMTIIKDLNQRGITTLLITHFMEEAAQADAVFVLDKGRIRMSGTPRQIFERTDELRALSLGVPPAVDLAEKLRDRGINIPGDVLSTDDIVRFLCQ